MRLSITASATRGFTLIEMLVSIGLMAVLATVLGNMLSVTAYQAIKARTDQKVSVLIDRELNFYSLVPYTELVDTVTAGASPAAMKVMDPNNTNFNYTVDPGPFPPGATNVYNSFEGTAALPTYLSNPPGGNGMYNYTITRTISLYPDHKEIDLWIDWESPSPVYTNLMSPYKVNPKTQMSNTVHQTYSANPIYRFP